MSTSKVAILSSSGKGEALAAALGGIGVTGSNQVPADIKRLVDAVMAKWGRVDVLVNSAGHGPRGPILEIGDDDWHKGMDVYLLSAIRPIRLVTPVMQQQKAGAIVNISTAWAFEPAAMFPTSAVFRAGLAAFAKIFADTYAADNIRINNVLPGWIDSLPAPIRFCAHFAQKDWRAARCCADEALRQDGGDRRDDQLLGVKCGGLHHRAEHQGGWRADAGSLTDIH